MSEVLESILRQSLAEFAVLAVAHVYEDHTGVRFYRSMTGDWKSLHDFYAKGTPEAEKLETALAEARQRAASHLDLGD